MTRNELLNTWNTAVEELETALSINSDIRAGGFVDDVGGALQKVEGTIHGGISDATRAVTGEISSW